MTDKTKKTPTNESSLTKEQILEQKLAKTLQAIKDKEKAIKDKEKALKELDKAIKAKDKALKAKDKEIEKAKTINEALTMLATILEESKKG